MADTGAKSIGKLTLDISDVKVQIEEVNKFLGQIGANVNLENKLSEKIGAALKSLVAEAKKAGEETANAMQQVSNAKGIDDANKKISEATKLWKEYYQLMTKAQNALNSGMTNKADFYYSEAQKLVKDVQALKEKAEATKEVTKAMREYHAAQEAGVDKSNAAIRREEERIAKEEAAIERAAKAAEAADQRKAESAEKAAQREEEATARAANREIEARKKTEAMYRNMFDQIDTKNLDMIIQKYEKMAEYATKAVTAYGNNDERNATAYLQEAEAIYKELQGLEQLYPELMKTARASEEAHDAQVKLNAAINTASNKQDAQAMKERADAIDAYKNAVIAMLNEQARFNQQVASGRLVEGSEQYAAAEEKLKHLEQAAIQAGQKLDQAGREAAMGMQEVQTAIDNVNQSMGAVNDSQQVSALTQVENAYKQLTTAIKNYQIAKKANNEEGMTYWQNQINGSMQVISLIEQEVNNLNVDAATRERILTLINQAKTQQDGMQKGVLGTSQATGELESQVKGLVTRYLSLMAVIRTISNLIKNMTEYVSEYSDKMNEIQMITMKTDAEVEQLAATYRELAKDMNVSSLDMADAAIYFTRQGLEAEEIEKRLKNVTMYAKAANVEFKDASEIITSVVNSMGLVEQEAEDGRNATQRVADVFLNIGDNAATSGQEIGEAMQKAAASAGAFGVSMEWLASYIATVSETTRQEARTIGTAFNTIIARLHQIKQTGYNQEDETKVNDIAKALKNIDVVLMDQEGNWRDMEDILVDIANEWDTLDDKTKSYIATTMAGVKQQNVFLALMNDMSKGVENGSRAFELHELALESDGVAAEKYAVYLDSVTAAQERLTIAQEEFYALLSQDVIKGWYNALAGIVSFITDATEAANGLNIVLPLVAGGIALIGVAISTLAEKAAAAGGVLTLLANHPVIATISAVVAGIVLLTSVIGGLNAAINGSSENFEKANTLLAESQENLEKYKKVQEDATDMFLNLGDQAKLSAEDIKEYNGTLEEIASVSPVAKHVVDELKAGFIDQKEAAKLLNDELERLVENEKKASMRSLVQRYANYQSDNMNSNDIAKLAQGMETDYLDIDDQERRFRNVLATAYGAGNLSKEFTERIKNAISDYMNNQFMTTDEAWDMLASDILYEMFGTFEVPENFTKSLVDQVQDEIDYVMSVVGANLDPVEYASVRKNLIDAIFGDDGELSSQEFSRFSNVIAQWVRDIAVNGTDKIMSEVDDLDLAKSIAASLFNPDEISEDLFEVSEEMQEGFSRGFIDSYKKLVKSGFSAEEIKGIFMDIPQSYWNEAADILKAQMETGIKNAFGTDFLGFMTPLIGEDGEYFGNAQNSLLWEEIDLPTMKTILEMAQAGAITLDEVNSMMLEADGSVEAFTEMLGGYTKEVGFAVEETEDFGDQIETMSDKVKKVKAAVKDIQALDAAIKDVQTNGVDANLSDIFSLTEAHPELMTVIGDTEALLDMLQKLRATAGDAQRELLKSIMLGDAGAMAGSKYAETGFATLKAYRESLTDEAELAKFDAEVEAWLDVLMKANEDFKQAAKDEAAEAKEATKSFSESVKEVEKLQKVINKIEEEKAVDFSDIIDLSTAHPEIIAFASDSEKLLEILKEIKSEAKEKVRLNLEESILDSDKWFENSKYAKSGYKTAREYINAIGTPKNEEEAKRRTEIEQDIKEATDNVVGVSDAYIELETNAKKAAAAEKEAAKDAKTRATEAAKAFNDNLKEVETLDKVISKLQDNNKVDFSDIINLASSHPEIVAYANDAEKLVEVLQRLKEEAKGSTKDSIKQILLNDTDYYQNSAYYDPRYENMRQYMQSIQDIREDWKQVDEEMNQAAENIVEAADASSTAAETWLEAQMKVAEINDQVNWAKSNHFEDQIKQLETANETGGIKAAIELFDSWDDKMQQAVGTEYPAFILQMVRAKKAMEEQGAETADLTSETKNLGAALKTAASLNDVKHFTDTAKAIRELSEGTINATDAYDTFHKEVNKVTKAYEDILDVQYKINYNAKEINKDNQQKIDASDVSNLATLLDMTTEEVLADFPAAVDMFNELTGAAGELTDVLNMLNDAAFIRITGTSDADFSAIEAGLISVQNLADEAVEKLLATGQWTTETVDLPQTAAIWHPGTKEKGGGYWSYETVTAGATVLKPTGSNPFKGNSTVSKKSDTKQKSSRSGGGGGGSSDKDQNFRDKKTNTEVEKMLDLMSQVQEIQQYQQSWYQSQQKYYQQTGQLQGVIAYMQQEKNVLEEQNKTLEKNVERIESYMEQKKAELAALSTSDEAYAEVADDLDKLQKAHQNYTKQLVDNKTAVNSLTEAMDEQRKKIRQMEIDIQQLIYKAIEDREAKKKDMLEGEISMENTILDLIIKRYEKERDRILEINKLKTDALENEKKLLDEELNLRKQEEEKEEKILKLRQLEENYERIVADPTRSKEAKSIKKEIDDLRKEMAWDAAEEEVESQKKAIDQQITSLEDYASYVEEYYEDLFEHPNKLIEEMKEILMGTHEEIIQWLKDNDETYQNSTEATQEKMVSDWEETYKKMKGIITTYWEEVYEIQSQGDDAIIQFLKDNSADYAAAGKLQAEAYVEEWTKKLADFKKAQESVIAEIAASYATIEQSTYEGSNSSGGGGGGGSGGGSGEKTVVKSSGTHGYGMIIDGKRVQNSGYPTKADAANAASAVISSYFNGSTLSGAEIRKKQNAASQTLVVYGKGGLATETGPAWLDGSETDPERVLSPYQTELFETMVSALERISTIPVSSMPDYGTVGGNGQGNVSVGDIVVNVDNLDTDDDYEELAQKVSDILVERIGRTSVVGGIRINTI